MGQYAAPADKLEGQSRFVARTFALIGAATLGIGAVLVPAAKSIRIIERLVVDGVEARRAVEAGEEILSFAMNIRNQMSNILKSFRVRRFQSILD